MNAKKAIGSATLVAAAFGVAACEVINPGPIQDEFLVKAESREGLVNGSQRRLNQAIGWIGYTGALVTRQIMPGGQTGSYGHNVLAQGGFIQPGGFGGNFNSAQQARFIAETAINLFADQEVEANIVAQANVWAGFSNRLLGENWCEAVIDGGPLLPGADYLRRAEEQFSTALSLNPNETLRMAATAGRASVRAFLGDWGGAASDAGGIPDGFEYVVLSDANVAATRNTPQWANARTPLPGLYHVEHLLRASGGLVGRRRSHSRGRLLSGDRGSAHGMVRGYQLPVVERFPSGIRSDSLVQPDQVQRSQRFVQHLQRPGDAPH